ncbi:type III-A CRISPR-associated RAMP protein Csm4 [Desulfobacca acetoxidans]|uniref:CRISPR system Cms protein Csm4 n=1 Tax=Desulfobacca acetoxidans (strain ATCC 700848 / DSM 11109 / ASRB2) TaxID=880072 RepID=F2NCZ0_DESAR|nr:hypothetical protein [Desulfobacca acetoxidans]AEB09564.1 hypothetical protein Desac_1723 [Desulfobacca acetoxidans DSM 11109]
MPTYEVCLWPRSSFEFVPRAETLFGAICWTIRSFWGENKLTDILAEFSRKPPFLLSSSFPCQRLRSGKIIHYLPRPILRPLSLNDIVGCCTEAKPDHKGLSYDSPGQSAFTWIMEQYKQCRKIAFITSAALDLFSSASDELPLFKAFLEGQLQEPKWRSNQGMAKTKIDRLGQATSGAGNLFFQEEQFLSQGWGLYFLVRTDHWSDLIYPVFRFLEDSGIGRNAHTGRNQFRLEWTAEPDWLPSGKGPRFICLSPYCQNIGDDIDWDASTYGVKSFQGAVESREEFAGSPVWKRRFLMVQEGSCLIASQVKDYYGCLVPSSEIKGKTVYTYAITWPLHLDMPKED